MAMPNDQLNFKNTLWDPMPKQIFNALDSIDTGLAWELSRTDVISQLLGPEAYGVPFLDESKLFEPFAVIAKVIVKQKPFLKYIGRLQDLIHNRFDNKCVPLPDRLRATCRPPEGQLRATGGSVRQR